MFNANKPVLQIGMEDGGGSLYIPTARQQQIIDSARLQELIKGMPPVHAICLAHNKHADEWTTQKGTQISIDSGSKDFQFVLKENETIVIKVLDCTIKCVKRPNRIAISQITGPHGEVFNTLQLSPSHPLVGMIRASVTIPLKDLKDA